MKFLSIYTHAPVSGGPSPEMIAKMTALIEEGMKVKEGQILARLDDSNVAASLKLAEAQFDSAKAALAEIKVRLRETELELQRISDLTRNKIATQADLDHAEARLHVRE